MKSKFYRSYGFQDECDFLMSTSGQFDPIVKKVKRQNEEKWLKGVQKVQMTLGFKS